MSIQRYECDCHPGNKCDEGEWVDYEDHAVALAEKDARIAELEGLLRRTIDWVASENSQQARSFATELRAALAAQEEASDGN